jgi:hypothetical protein
MSDREDFDIDSPDAAKALLGEQPRKKKPKAKAKAKARPKRADASVQIPLSLQDASTDDIAMFQAKRAAFKAQKGQSQAYKASVRFSAGEVMDHKSFGLGFVLSESGLNKIEVLFEGGRKLLVTAPRQG